MLHLSNKQEVTKVYVSYLNLTFAEKQQVIPVKKMKKKFSFRASFGKACAEETGEYSLRRTRLSFLP